MPLPKITLILGPTASGKTEIAIQLAKKFKGEVLSADSRQIYREMTIGTGKPVGVWRDYVGEQSYFVDDIPHFGLDYVAPDAPYSAADFQAYSYQKIDQILARGHHPIITVGTGLYGWAIVDNLDWPADSPDISSRKQYENSSLEVLIDKLKTVDPDGYAFVDKKNRRRVIRALEIAQSGASIARRSVHAPRYTTLQIGLLWPREILNERIARRIQSQVLAGWEAEARKLLQKYDVNLPSLSSIGYREWAAFNRGELTRNETIRALTVATSRYAKKQMMWFKRDKRIEWVTGGEGEAVNQKMREFLK